MVRKPKAWPPVYSSEPGADPRSLSALLIAFVEWMRVRGMSENGYPFDARARC